MGQSLIIRTYQCNECNWQFEVQCESGDDGDPPCPECEKILQWVPGMFHVKTDKSRAIDYTQKVVEEDFGLTDLNDRNREGDVAYRAPPAPSAVEREKVERQIREYVAQSTAPVPAPSQPQSAPAAAPLNANFWGAQPTGGIQANPIAAQTMIAGVRQGPQFPDRNPMKLLQQGIKSGHLRSPARIVARWRP